MRSLLLDRNSVPSDDIVGAKVELRIHAFEWTREAKPAFNHHVVHFCFHDVDELALQGFNHQNAILELKVEDYLRYPDTPANFRVTLVPAFGLAGSFCAGSGQVLSVVPCGDDGVPKKSA